MDRPESAAARADPRDEGFGLYIHWPWCLSKCPYCDFNSHVMAAPDPARWAGAYVRDLTGMARWAPRRPLTSIFIGGGTPSLMAPSIVAAILDAAAALWPLADDLEVTLEANPGAVDRDRFRGFRSAGVNRLSLGVQALDDAALTLLGRRHGRAEALAALALARETFERVSCDLIYARPGQTLAAWAAELDEVLAVAPDHLSPYQLTIEKGTPFFAAHRDGALVLPDEDTAAALYDLTQTRLEAAGLPAYEISNHARPGAESRHNMVYWRGGDSLGCGPGAHGRVDRLATRAVAAPGAWLEQVERTGDGLQARDMLTAAERALERLLMGLRLREGIAAGRFGRLSGLRLESILDPDALADLTDAGFITWDGARLRATDSGRACLDAVLVRLAVPPDQGA